VTSVSEDPVGTMLDKLHQFSSAELDPGERGVLGALLAPGIQWALDQSPDDEVAGFGLVMWTPDSLANGLRRALAERAEPTDPGPD
jgi:hypothetical protein